MLVVRAGGARLFPGSRRTLLGPALDFAADEAGYGGLRRHLEHSALRPIHLLVDLVEEDFQRETAPHVHGPARRAVLATRSARLFPGNAHVSVRREGRVPEGRRDDRVLFSAIVRPERLDPWLEALRGYAVAGVHSLPLVSARLLPLLGVETGRVLLVTTSGEGELRQTLFEDGRLILSRLAPLPPGGSSDRARCIVAEVERLLQHLERSGHAGEELRIRLVGDAPLHDSVRALRSPHDPSGWLVDAAEVERRIGGRRRTGDDHGDGGPRGGCDRMFARLTLRRRPPNHYAPAAALALHRTNRAGRALKAVGLAVLLAAAAWSASVWNRSGRLDAAAESLAREADGYEARYRRERRPEPEVAPDDLRLAVETAQRLDAGRVRALAVLRTVSEALAGFPDLELESLEWFEVSDREGWSPPAGEDAPRERFRIVHLRGRIEPFGGHYRAAAGEVFRFADGLEADPRLSEVDVTGLPRDPGAGGHWDRSVAGFEVRMVLDVQGD